MFARNFKNISGDSMKHLFATGLAFFITVSPICSANSMENVPTTSNDELRTLLSAAINRFEQTERHQWSYRVHRYENEEGEITSSIEHFLPRPQGQSSWTLEQSNGQIPTAKQQATFREQKAEQQSNKGESNNHFSLKLRELINLNSIQFESANDQHIKARFDVTLEKLGERASRKLTGLLHYDQDLGYIESITISNTDSFSPMFSANIEHFELTISFTIEQDQVLPHEQNLTMRGTFAIFSEIDEVSKDRFTDYRFIPNDNQVN